MKQTRSTEAISTSVSFIKSARDLEKTMLSEKSVMKGYQPPAAKPSRRFFKNFFGLKYATGNDKFAEDKRLNELTNPSASARALKRETIEAMTMSKRHEAALLRDKIMKSS